VLARSVHPAAVPRVGRGLGVSRGCQRMVRDGDRQGKQSMSKWIAETNCDYDLFQDGIATLGRVASERIAKLPKAWPDRRRLGIVLQKPKPEGITYAVKLMVAVQR
jgi:hypothetical protein